MKPDEESLTALGNEVVQDLACVIPLLLEDSIPPTSTGSDTRQYISVAWTPVSISSPELKLMEELDTRYPTTWFLFDLGLFWLAFSMRRRLYEMAPKTQGQSEGMNTCDLSMDTRRDSGCFGIVHFDAVTGDPPDIARGARSGYPDLASSPSGWVANNQITPFGVINKVHRYVHSPKTLAREERPMGDDHVLMSKQNSSRKNYTTPPKMYIPLNATECSRIPSSYTNDSEPSDAYG
ncbi:hypothetical protein EV421DRAFT_1739120 [Armillaria borealis]|uniref:Uncharacterized protein n=1 Tax=Armillaria borealis TaxID=47425 RepID=A0AA39MKU0_9AGAR|nr:hypothetical protein EV421DRAFT_1739120 [Armillaria borealis]